MQQGTFVIIGTVLLIGFFGNLARDKTKIPESLFLLIAGILIGPVFHLFGTSSLLSISSLFTSIALVIVLMEGGMNLDLFGVMRNLYKALAFMSLSSLITISFITIWMHYIFMFPWITSLLIGIALGGTTSITVLHLIERLKIEESIKDILVLESVLTDVLLITAAIIVLQFTQMSNLSIQTIISNIVSQISIAFLFGFLSAVMWIYFLSKVARRHSLLYIATLGFLFILYDVVEFSGGNGPIAVLVFSLFAGNLSRIASQFRRKTMFSEVKESLLSSIRTIEREFTFFITTFFFVYIGMLVDFSYFNVSTVVVMISLFLMLIMSRMMASWIYGQFNHVFRKYVFLVSTTIPKGFSAILVTMMAFQSGFVGKEFINIVVVLMFVSTLAAVIGNAAYFRMKRHRSRPSRERKPSSK